MAPVINPEARTTLFVGKLQEELAAFDQSVRGALDVYHVECGAALGAAGAAADRVAGVRRPLEAALTSQLSHDVGSIKAGMVDISGVHCPFLGDCVSQGCVRAC